MIVFGYFQIGKAIPTTPWEMVLNATLVTKIVLGLLAVLSLLSWAVMFGKWVEFRRVRSAADAFIRSFDRAQSLDEVATLAKHAKASPFTRVFDRGFAHVGGKNLYPDFLMLTVQVFEEGDSERIRLFAGRAA